jgi:hypothetical protein
MTITQHGTQNGRKRRRWIVRNAHCRTPNTQWGPVALTIVLACYSTIMTTKLIKCPQMWAMLHGQPCHAKSSTQPVARMQGGTRRRELGTGRQEETLTKGINPTSALSSPMAARYNPIPPEVASMMERGISLISLALIWKTARMTKITPSKKTADKAVS